jgi:hypothetical protein
MHSKMISTLAGAALCLGMSAAHAAQWNFTLTGTVVYADVGNAYNLVDYTQLGNSAVTVTGIFDDSSLTNGTGVISFAPGNMYGNTFTITAGDVSFTPDEDITGGIYPIMTLASWLLDTNANGLNILATDSVTGATFNAYFGGFDGDDTSWNQIAGNWTNLSVTAVPEAETYAMMLAGLGLVGWMGARRKSRAA